MTGAMRTLQTRTSINIDPISAIAKGWPSFMRLIADENGYSFLDPYLFLHYDMFRHETIIAML